MQACGGGILSNSIPFHHGLDPRRRAAPRQRPPRRRNVVWCCRHRLLQELPIYNILMEVLKVSQHVLRQAVV